jgi:glutaminyl-peptide cyclotransferase
VVGTKDLLFINLVLDEMLTSLRILPCSLLTLLFTSTVALYVEPRSLTTFSDTDLVSLGTTPSPTKNIDPYNPHSHLYNILIPRPCESQPIFVNFYVLTTVLLPAGTENNTIVRNYIVRTLRNLNWHVEEDEFEDNTPYGKKRFANVIATKDPEAPRRIILSAHFDSKFFPSPPMNGVSMKLLDSFGSS